MSPLSPSIVAAVLAIIITIVAAIIDRKISSTRSSFLIIKPALLIMSAILVGACSMFIAQFAKMSVGIDIGIIPICGILALFASPIAGVLIAFAPSIIFILKGYSSIKTNLIVAAFTFLLGLFFFDYYGCM